MRLLLVLLLFLEPCFCLSAKAPQKEIIKIKIGADTYSFELADSPRERLKGLMFRKELAPASGMFFVFDKPGYLKFHMENTFIPLDIAFLDSSFKVLDIQSMKPMDKSVVTSSLKALYALEVKRGFFKKTGLGIGDKIEIVEESD